jgi:hypothetical protein
MVVLVALAVVIYTMACAATITYVQRVIYPALKEHPFWGSKVLNKKGVSRG